MADLKLSPLDAEHRALQAHMGAFAGWDMPISYEGTVGEHTAVRTAAGVFDVSHLGKIWVRGGAARALADRALTNRLADLPEGAAKYTLMLDDGAGIVDDMIVYAFGADELLVVPNAANVDDVERRLLDTGGAAEVDVRQSQDAILALQGPRSRQVLDTVLAGVPALEYMHCARVGHMAVCRSGYTGEHGYEIFCSRDDAPGLFKAILDCGVTPCGLAARDTLRLEMGYPLHGNDIDLGTMPSEAGLMWAVGKDKPAFAGKDALESREPRSRLAGIVMDDRVIPRRGCAVFDGEEPVGECTSGSFSPTLKRGVALARIARGASLKEGSAVRVEVRGKVGEGTVAKPPFVDASPKR